MEPDFNTPNENTVQTESENSQNEFHNFIKHVSGISFDDPEIGETLIGKRNDLRRHYNLPSREKLLNNEQTLPEYNSQLSELANKNNIGIIGDLEEYKVKKGYTQQGITGLFADDDDNKIHISNNFNSSNPQHVKILEHELIHALQYKFKPNMPVEQKEFEAYLCADAHDEILQSEKFRDILFSLIQNSSVYWYQQNNKNIPWKKTQL